MFAVNPSFSETSAYVSHGMIRLKRLAEAYFALRKARRLGEPLAIAVAKARLKAVWEGSPCQ
jgi:hypothetical protein